MKKEDAWETDIILVDIIGFSKLEPYQQLEIIQYTTNIYIKMINKMLDKSDMVLNDFISGYIATGDGFFCILNPNIKGYGTILGLNFTFLSDHISKKYSYFEGIRVAVHTGEICQFKDILGHKNYIGDGLNDCVRYLEVKNFSISTVMISDKAYHYLKKFLTINEDFNLLLIKHGFKHSVMHEFRDKHSNIKRGCFVWLRELGIMDLPKL